MRTRVVLTLLCASVALSPPDASARAPGDAGGARPAALTPQPTNATHAANCYEAYWNVALPTGYYFPAGTGVEVMDDLHLGDVYVTGVCAFDMGYYNAGAVPVNAVVRFYAGNAADDPPGALLATFGLPGLATGENFLHVEVPGSTIGQDVWMGVTFNSDVAGLELAEPTLPGASDDYLYMTPPGQFFTFGSNPTANFMLGVYALGTPVTGAPGAPFAGIGFAVQPYPNPSRGRVAFQIAVPVSGPLRVEVLDIAGRSVAVLADRISPAGLQSMSWDGRMGGRRAPSGVYMIRVQMTGFAASRKVAILD